MKKPALTIAIDIDGTATEQPAFFAMLCALAGVRVVVLTAREESHALVFLQEHGIRFDQLIADCVADESKARCCEEMNVDVFFEDEDERIRHVPRDTVVFKTRNGGNYCFRSMKWLVNSVSDVKLSWE